MADHLTFTLGARGYRAYKYVPYGPVYEVLPYLLRRAHENGDLLSSNVAGERALLVGELARRARAALGV
jgi:proline dehydrogenase